MFWCSSGLSGAMSQVRAVLALAVTFGQTQELSLVDEVHAVRDLLDARDMRALSLLQDVHELTGLDQALVRAGVEPGHAAAKLFHPRLPAFHVGAVDVGDLQLPACRRFEQACDLQYLIVVEVEACDGQI